MSGKPVRSKTGSLGNPRALILDLRGCKVTQKQMLAILSSSKRKNCLQFQLQLTPMTLVALQWHDSMAVVQVHHHSQGRFPVPHSRPGRGPRRPLHQHLPSGPCPREQAQHASCPPQANLRDASATGASRCGRSSSLLPDAASCKGRP